MQLTDDDLTRLERLCDGATQGEWERSESDGYDYITSDGEVLASVDSSTANAEFIAATGPGVARALLEANRENVALKVDLAIANGAVNHLTERAEAAETERHGFRVRAEKAEAENVELKERVRELEKERDYAAGVLASAVARNVKLELDAEEGGLSSCPHCGLELPDD